MLKLLLLTLGTWSVLSLLLVGTLGVLLHLRQQSGRTPAILRRAEPDLCADGYRCAPAQSLRTGARRHG